MDRVPNREVYPLRYARSVTWESAYKRLACPVTRRKVPLQLLGLHGLRAVARSASLFSVSGRFNAARFLSSFLPGIPRGSRFASCPPVGPGWMARSSAPSPPPRVFRHGQDELSVFVLTRPHGGDAVWSAAAERSSGRRPGSRIVPGPIRRPILCALLRRRRRTAHRLVRSGRCRHRRHRWRTEDSPEPPDLDARQPSVRYGHVTCLRRASGLGPRRVRSRRCLRRIRRWPAPTP
jgi:hypothetical protein